MAEAVVRSARLPDVAKYEIIEEIGHGGMATVYRARDRRLGREVALKVVHPHLRDSREVVTRFNAEARAVAKLRHRNIVEVYDVSSAEDAEQYLVCELVRGTTLRKLLETRKALPPEIAALVALELLAALAHAHAAGVVHRDIKPENVLIEHAAKASGDAEVSDRPSQGSRAIVKLTDFGIAKLLDAQGVTSTGQVLGSPAHMAPEQIEGGEVDVRADVFGLGVLLYECMVGHLPFEGSNPAQVLKRVLDGAYPAAVSERPVVGKRWSVLLDRALAHAPDDRFADAASMKAALLDELSRTGVSAAENDLETWMDGPDGYENALETRMIERLCALAVEDRKRGDFLSAASDCNRALAYSPDDPRLLRMVAGMHRAKARTRTLKAGAIALVLLASVVAVARWARHVAVSHGQGPMPAAAGSVGVELASSLASAAAVAPAVTQLAGAESTRRVIASPKIVPPTRALDRAITLDLRPPMGVAMSLDGQPPREVSTGDKVALDAKPHWLTFSCPRRGGDDPCVAVRLAVAAGDRDDTLVVSVPVKPATLIVDGDASHTYQVTQHPELAVRAGANAVPLKSAFDHVTVVEIETGTSVPVRLEAGQSVHASFH